MMVASAVLTILRPPSPDPLKITSAMSLPRRLLALCSPSTHLMASTMLDLPEPLGPTMTVMPGGNSKRVLSAKLLKPINSRALSMGGKGGDGCQKAGGATNPPLHGRRPG